MRIACFETDEYERAYLEQALKDHILTFHERPLEIEDAKELGFTDALVVFIYSHVTKEIIERLPCLKLIVTLSTGYDHIDLKACKDKGIAVCNVPKYGGAAVAEHTFALMLALARHIPQAVQKTAHDDFSLDSLCGFELAGKTLGVIGAGTIGSAVIQRARAFEMNVLVHERTPNNKLSSDINIKHVSLSNLLKNSDIVTLHIPYNPSTYHFINRKALKLMKQGSFLINTARGGLVDTKALADALASKHLAGAALDVLEGEREHKEAHAHYKNHHLRQHDWRLIRETHRLLKRPNVLITPHMAFYTREAMHKILSTTTDNIASFAKGRPVNCVG